MHCQPANRFLSQVVSPLCNRCRCPVVSQALHQVLCQHSSLQGSHLVGPRSSLPLSLVTHRQADLQGGPLISHLCGPAPSPHGSHRADRAASPSVIPPAALLDSPSADPPRSQLCSPRANPQDNRHHDPQASPVYSRRHIRLSSRNPRHIRRRNSAPGLFQVRKVFRCFSTLLLT